MLSFSIKKKGFILQIIGRLMNKVADIENQSVYWGMELQYKSNQCRKQGGGNTILNPFDRQTISVETAQGEWV